MKNKNTYSMILEAEKDGRSIFEAIIYGLVVICVTFTGWQFASHSVTVPGENYKPERTGASMIATVPDEQPIAIASAADANAL